MSDTMDQMKKFTYIPTWSASNIALLDVPKRKARICVLPIVPTSTTHHSVQLTFFTKFKLVTKYISGKNNCKCVLTLDLNLYKPVQKLIISRVDLHHRWIERPCELHTVFAMMPVIGIFIDGTEIPYLWLVLYGDNTISQIFSSKKSRRSVEAHICTLVALQNCCFQHFFLKNT